MRLVRRDSRRMWALALAVAAVAPLAGRPGVAPRVSPRPLVMPFSVRAENPASVLGPPYWLTEGAAVLLTDALAGLGAAVCPRDQRVQAFDRLQVPNSTTITHATMIRAGEFLDASHVVFGEVLVADDVTIHARVVSLDAGFEHPAIVERGPASDVFGLFDRVANKIAAAIGHGAPAVPAGSRHPPLDVFQLYVRGLMASTPQAAQKLLETALKQAPRDPGILMALWSAYALQGLHEKALAAAVSIAPDSSVARRARFAGALSLIELKRFDGAFKELSALAGASATAAVNNALGVIQLRRVPPPGTPSAASLFQQAIVQEPANRDYLFNVGYAEALAHRNMPALGWLREAARAEPTRGDAHLVMSAMLAADSRSAEAAREFDLARQLGTRIDLSARAVSEVVPTGLERLPATSDDWCRETAAARLGLARAFLDGGDRTSARREAERALVLDPTSTDARDLIKRAGG